MWLTLNGDQLTMDGVALTLGPLPGDATSTLTAPAVTTTVAVHAAVSTLTSAETSSILTAV